MIILAWASDAQGHGEIPGISPVICYNSSRGGKRKAWPGVCCIVEYEAGFVHANGLTEEVPLKKKIGIVLMILAAAGLARPQEIFDVLRKGDVQAVKAMIEISPQLVDARDGGGATPLHYASYGTDPALLRFLIDKGAKLEVADAEGRTPLHCAVMNDRRDVAAALLERGAAFEARDDYQRTALILCARERGQAATGRLLIEAGADVNAKDKFGSDALELAAWRGKADFVDLLLEKGAQVPESGERWQMGLSEAASQGLSKLFRRLIEGKPDSTVLSSGPSLLHDAAAGGSAEIVGLLLDKGYDSVRADRFGWTPLHYAARDGRTDAARMLIGKGAPLNARTIMGQTAYNVAVERKMEAAAGLLAEKGADRSDIRFPVLEGDYFGQKPPEGGAELFGLGIISSIWGLHSTAVFSPDGNEVYWAPMETFPGELYSKGGLLMMRRDKGRWTPPALAPFSGYWLRRRCAVLLRRREKDPFHLPPSASRRNGERNREDMVRRQDLLRLVRAPAHGPQRQFDRQALGILS